MKSEYLIAEALSYADVEGFSGILFRKSFADMVQPDSIFDRTRKILAEKDGVKLNAKEYKFTFFERVGKRKIETGVLKFGYLDKPNDCERYQGAQYTFLGFDELAQLNENNYLYLHSRLRAPKSVKIPLKIRSACNPPRTTEGLWVYDRFVKPDPTRDPSERLFIQASLRDNPYLDFDDYSKKLENLDPVTREQLLNGNWEVKKSSTLFNPRNEQYITSDKLPLHRRKVIYWDLAATSEDECKEKGRDADYTAGCVMSVCNGNYYIEDLIHGRWSAQGVIDLQVKKGYELGRGVPVLEELQPGSSGKMLVDLKRRTTELGKFRYEALRVTGSKLNRLEPFAAAFESKKIFFVEGCSNLQRALDELYTFGISNHDDLPDCISGAFNYLQEMSKSSAPKMIGVRNSAFAQTSSGLYVPNNGNYWRNF